MVAAEAAAAVLLDNDYDDNLHADRQTDISSQFEASLPKTNLTSNLF